MKRLFVCLLILSSYAHAISGKIKDDFYFDKDQKFKINLDEAWLKDIVETESKNDSGTAFFDGEGRSITICVKKLPPKLLDSFKGKELKVLKFFAYEFSENFSQKHSIKVVEDKVLDLPDGNKGFYRYMFCPKAGLLTEKNSKIPPDGYFGMLFYLKNDNLVTLIYIDSALENHLKVKLNENLESIKTDYVKQVTELSTKITLLK